MPLYSVKCQVCEKTGSARLSFAEYDQAKEGTFQVTCPDPECEGWAEIVFNPGDVAFVLKDGESGGWVSKAQKENAFRAKHNRVMDRRMRDHAPRTRLQPNVGGLMTPTWKDAKEVAYEQTYDKVKEEHGTDTARQAATESAKTYDPLVNREVTGS